MKHFCIFILTLTALFSMYSLSDADIYKFVDSRGVLHFTNIPSGSGYKMIMKETADSTYDRIIHRSASKYNIEPSIIRAVITMESNWDPEAVSQKGAMGLMQLMPGTAKAMHIANPFNPAQNIEGGTRYLRRLLDRFGEDLDLALAAYNAGPAQVERSGGIPDFRETTHFVKNVTELYRDSITSQHIYRVNFKDGTVLYTNKPSAYKPKPGS